MTRDGFKTKIRGIYSTALTRLLLDHGFEIVQPSEEIIERFGLEASNRNPDFSIRDRRDQQGIRVYGGAEALEALQFSLREELLDVIIMRRVGRDCLDVEFPWTSKRRLDEYRGTMLPTVKSHHYYKACGGEISSAASMAEKLLQRGRSLKEVEELLRRTVEPYLPFEGSEVDIEHVKLNGFKISLGRAVIENYDEESRITYRREMMGGGLYDGLGVEKEAGDYAVTKTRLGGYHTETRYYSKTGRFKGAYLNLNTPVELYPSKIRYVDLEVDICIWPSGDIKVIDEELLERAAIRGIITDELYEVVREKTEKLLARDRSRNY